MFQYIIWTFIFYWLFRFIFNFLLPVLRATRQMKGKMQDFNSRMGGQGNYQGAAGNASSTPPPRTKTKDDYIDFEEVK